MNEIEAAKQKAQEIAARLLNSADPSKRPRVDNGGGGGGGGFDSSDYGNAAPMAPPSSGKVFSDEDEIDLLKALALFWADGEIRDWALFHCFSKDKLRHKFKKRQLSEKIRRLRLKYGKNVEMGGRDVLSSQHEIMLFEMSERLWGEKMSYTSPQEQLSSSRFDAFERYLVATGSPPHTNLVAFRNEQPIYEMLKMK